jgi:hypothetical protein
MGRTVVPRKLNRRNTPASRESPSVFWCGERRVPRRGGWCSQSATTRAWGAARSSGCAPCGLKHRTALAVTDEGEQVGVAGALGGLSNGGPADVRLAGRQVLVRQVAHQTEGSAAGTGEQSSVQPLRLNGRASWYWSASGCSRRAVAAGGRAARSTAPVVGRSAARRPRRRAPRRPVGRPVSLRRRTLAGTWTPSSCARRRHVPGLR